MMYLSRTMILIMFLLLSLLGYFQYVRGEVASSISHEVPQPFFVSVMVMERNQSSMLLEFVRHYLEEGIDHFFIYNLHNTPHIHSELRCIDSKYYTVLPQWNNITTSGMLRQKVYDYIKPQTKWLIQVDSDDYISSRASPDSSIRDILESGIHSMCQIISVPSINYAWGSTVETPTGKVRTTLTHRWGYHHRFNNTAVKQSRGHKFRDAFDQAKNKVIFQTAAVDVVRTNFAKLTSRGVICISSENVSSACSKYAKKKADEARALDTHNTTRSARADAGALTELNLPRYCPERNTFRARRSSSALYLLEDDIPSLTLACHHYRVPSLKEWHRRTHSHPQHYQHKDIALANRMDIVDTYMLQRVKERQSHAQFILTSNIMKACVGFTDATTSPSSTTISMQQDPIINVSKGSNSIEKQAVKQNRTYYFPLLYRIFSFFTDLFGW